MSQLPYHHHHNQPQHPPLLPDARYLPRARPRGDDGRFVPRADDHLPADNHERKVCGWCGRSQTSQWRVGPTTGSLAMGTLCNACGINYRRALQKAPNGVLDLDALAQQQGTRLSIQKALKRQRKLSPVLAQFKRTRPTERERRPSSLNMLLSDDVPPAPTPSSWQHQPHRAMDGPLTSMAPPLPPLPLPSGHYGSSSSSGSSMRGTSGLPAPPSGLSRSARLRNDRLPPFDVFVRSLARPNGH